MTDKWLYEVFKVVISNFSLVLFLVIGAIRLYRQIEVQFVDLKEIKKQIDTMEKRLEELRDLLQQIPKRKED